jgi:anti-anti-sigma factor
MAELDQPVTAQLHVSVSDPAGGGAVTVTAAGEIDLCTAPALSQALEKALSGAPSQVDVELSGVSFLDASGVSAILQCWDRAELVGVRLRLLRPRPFVRRVLDLTEVTTVCEVVD